MPDCPALSEALEEFGIRASDLASARRLGGGDISAAWRVQTSSGPVFLKTAGIASKDLFAAEAEGLKQLQHANEVRVPRVLATGASRADSFLALEWLDLGPSSPALDRAFGRQLALLHSHTGDRHGWKSDNWIGRTPQPNTWTESWSEFFRDYRLAHQLEMAARNGFSAELGKRGARLIDALPAFFAHYDPRPCLLHGDLWAGNRSSVAGEPVIFDPAVYYGDRESDLAMTRLFGGFSREFYIAYEKSWPLSPGHEQRVILYQLYHVLNHLNLFGRGYLGQACALLDNALTNTR